MSEIKRIGKKILEDNQNVVETQVTDGTYFENPVYGDLNYHSFADFSSESELAIILEEHLNNYGLSATDFLELAKLAYGWYEQKNNGNDDGNLSDFVYIMH